MFIKYHWENVECNIEDKDNEFEMKTHKETRDVDYEYNRDVTVEDIVQYLMPYSLTRKGDKTKDEVNEIRLANFYMTKAIEFMQEHGIEINGGDLETELEDDEYFVEYMHDKYEEEAFEEWDEYYNEEL